MIGYIFSVGEEDGIINANFILGSKIDRCGSVHLPNGCGDIHKVILVNNELVIATANHGILSLHILLPTPHKIPLSNIKQLSLTNETVFLRTATWQQRAKNFGSGEVVLHGIKLSHTAGILQIFKLTSDNFFS